MRIILRAVAFALVIAICDLGASTLTSAAQQWPQRLVRIIVPIGPGTATDLTARLYAERLAERWGQPVVVENRPGADGIIAINGFLGARDEHTLLFSFGGPVTVNQTTHEKLPYDPVRDLVPIAAASESFLTIMSSTSLGVNSIDELVRLARSQPGKLSWAATPGLPQILFAGFKKSAELDMVEVSYRDFTPALQDLGEGRISVVSTSLQNALVVARAGKAKLLVIAGGERAPLAPEVPTATEAGYPDLAGDSIQGFFGWRDMPDELRERIAADVRAIAADPAIAARLAPFAQVVRSGTPAEFTALLDKQRTKVAAIAKAIGMKPTK